MAIRTIFTTAEGCAKGLRQGWFDFVRDYGAIADVLLAHYYPGLASELPLHMQSVFARANADGNAWFRSLHFSNEREFSMAFRQLVFVYGNHSQRMTPPEISADSLVQAQEGLMLVQRQIFWLYLRGWSADEASSILTNAASTAQEVRQLADERLALIITQGSPTNRLAAARGAMESSEHAHTADCLSWKTMDNIINGQIAWRDRQASERHMNGCNHCLNAFTSFQEMIWLRTSAKPLPQAEIDSIVRTLHVQGPKGLFSRLLAG